MNRFSLFPYSFSPVDSFFIFARRGTEHMSKRLTVKESKRGKSELLNSQVLLLNRQVK